MNKYCPDCQFEFPEPADSPYISGLDVNATGYGEEYGGAGGGYIVEEGGLIAIEKEGAPTVFVSLLLSYPSSLTLFFSLSLFQTLSVSLSLSPSLSDSLFFRSIDSLIDQPIDLEILIYMYSDLMVKDIWKFHYFLSLTVGLVSAEKKR